MKKMFIMAAIAAMAAMVATADDYGFTYQAELKDERGQTLESRNQTVEIRLWKNPTGTSQGDLLWGRTYSIYTDENGLFNQEVSDSLGSPTSDDPGLKLSTVFCNNGAGAVYLGLKVKDSAGEIVPRQRLFAVPFAGRANSANNLVGDAHNVEGSLQWAGKSSLSPSGLVLPTESSSTLGAVTAESVTCRDGDVVAANLAFTGKLTGPNSREIVPVPVGGVIMWTQKTPPEGGEWDSTGKGGHWAICNGENGTPNLSGRFVVGVGEVTDKEGNKASYSLNDNADGLNRHKLTIAETPEHTHTMDFNENKVDFYDEDHWVLGDTPGSSCGDKKARTGPTKTTSAVGSSNSHENRPPYYALYYIMRVK